MTISFIILNLVIPITCSLLVHVLFEKKLKSYFNSLIFAQLGVYVACLITWILGSGNNFYNPIYFTMSVFGSFLFLYLKFKFFLKEE